MKISNLEFKNNVFLAPMAGVTDSVFRGICKEMECGLVYTEMVSAKGLYYGSENTEKLLRIKEHEKPVAVQIFGNEPYIMAKSCEYFNDNKDISIVDVNMGCPAPKIVRNGEGSALMKSPKLAAEIIRELKKVSVKPVTVKFRKGFDEDHINAVDFAKEMEQAGADAITIHGRTRAQMYTGKSDREIIAEIKNSVKIPVIGNGDIFLPEDAKEMFDKTKCDAIMVARGSMGNPWLFKQIHQALNNEKITYPTAEEKIRMCIKHLQLELQENDERKVVREMRKHIGWYVKGLKDCTEIKNKINYEKTAYGVVSILESYIEQLLNE